MTLSKKTVHLQLSEGFFRQTDEQNQKQNDYEDKTLFHFHAAGGLHLYPQHGTD